MPTIALTRGNETRYVSTSAEYDAAQKDGFRTATGEVPFVDRAGNAIGIPEASAGVYLERPEYSSPDVADTLAAADTAERQRVYGGTAEAFRAGGEGAIRGVLPVIGDWLFERAGVSPEDLRGREEVHPGVSGAAELAGTALTLGAGGEGLLAEGLRATPYGLASKLGRGTEEAFASRLGTAAAELGEDGVSRLVPGIANRSAFSKIAASTLGNAAEGAAIGGLQAGNQLVLSDDPVDWEKGVSSISSGMLFGGSIGGAIGLFGRAFEQGLGKAGRALEDHATMAEQRLAAETDLTQHDMKTLNSMERQEVNRIKTVDRMTREGHEAEAAVETERMEAEREAQHVEIDQAKKAERENIAAEHKAQAEEFVVKAREHRDQLMDERNWDAVEGLEPKKPKKKKGAAASDDGVIPIHGEPTIPPIRGAQSIRKRLVDSDKKLRNMLDTPETLAERPYRLKEALEMSLYAYQEIVERSPEIREALIKAGREGGRSWQMLDKIEGTLGRIRDLRGRIKALDVNVEKIVTPELERLQAAKEALDRAPLRSPVLDEIERKIEALKGVEPASEQLSKIRQAKEVVQQPKSLKEKVAYGGAYSLAAGGLHMVLPGPLGVLAPVLAPGLAEKLTDFVMGRMGKATGEVSRRAAKAIDRFLKPAAEKSIRSTLPVLSILNAVSYAPPQKERRSKEIASNDPSVNAYRERMAELREITQPGPTGKPIMTPKARRGLAKALKPLAAISLKHADMAETIGARRVEFLASKAATKSDLFAVQIGPPKTPVSQHQVWEMSRYMAAAEDPPSLYERLADGTIVPQDVEAVQAVVPEWYGQERLKVVAALATLPKNLPPKKRLALSIFLGAPVDPLSHPQVIAMLQNNFADESGTEGGTVAPTAQPQFGSLTKPTATPAQERAG